MELYFYIICLGVGVLFTLGSVFFGHLIGGGHADVGGHMDGSGGHAETGMDNTDMPGVSAFSPLIISSFVASFGGLGIIFHEIPATQAPWFSAPFALAGAFLIAATLVSLLRKIFRATQSSSESRLSQVTGMLAQVITAIPENGVGEIAYIHGGSRYTAAAREDSGRAVANGSQVRIKRATTSQFFVSAV
jgi:membrane protein implicated in regulation of membrane protease activity